MRYRMVVLCKWNTYFAINMQVKTNLQRIGKIFTIISRAKWSRTKRASEREKWMPAKYSKSSFFFSLSSRVFVYVPKPLQMQCILLCVYAQLRELFMCAISSLSCVCVCAIGRTAKECSVWKCLMYFGQFTKNWNKRKMNIYTNNLQIAYA